MMRRRGERCPRLVPVLVILAGALIGSAIHAAAPARPVNRVVLCERTGCDGSDIRFQNQSAAPIPADVDFGFSTAMGYLDGDKLADMVVGAPGENRVYVFFGGVDNASPGQTLANRALDASAADVIITGDLGTQFGFSVAIPPPTGGDYSQPVIIGAPGMTAGAPGAAYIVPSKNPLSSEWASFAGTPVLSSFTQRIRFAGVNNGDEAGYMVAAGEVFSAGSTDFVVSARRGDRTPSDPNDDSGIVYVIDGLAVSPGSVIGLATMRSMIGAVPRGGLGESLAIGNFLTGVTGNEIAVTGVGTIPNDSTNPAGRLYVVSVPLSVLPGTPIDLMLGGSTPMRRVRGDTNNDFFGFSLAALDLDPNTAANGNELAVGTIYADRAGPPFQKNAGAVYLYRPAELATLSAPGNDPTVDPAAGTTARRIVWGQRLWDEFGFGLASGDVTGDGVNDLVAAARWHDRDQTVVNEVDEGTVYLFSGTSLLSATTPLLLDCGPTCASAIPGVDALIFGGDYGNSHSEEIGFSLSVGDFNQDSVYDDIAIASIAHERVYLVSLNSGDQTPPAAAPGQETDTERDIRDRDDDGDGYTDVEEDSLVMDGIYNPGGSESDTLVPNRDATVSVDFQDPNNIVLKCDGTIEVRVTVSNSGRRISFVDPEVMISLPSSPFIYDPGSTVIVRKGVSTPVPDGGGSAFPFLAFRSITASGTARTTDPLLGTLTIPSTLADQTIEVRFRLKAALPLAYNAVTAGMVNATVRLKSTENEELPYPGLGLSNTDDLTVNLIRPFLRATKSASDVNGGTLDPLDEILYTVIVSNPAPSATYRAASVVLTDIMPANCTFVTSSATTTQGTVSGGGTLMANLGTININGTATVTFKCQISETVANNTIISNQAIITEPCQGTVRSDSTDALDNDASETGNNPTDASDDDTTKDTVIVNPVIVVAKSANKSTATVDDVVNYTYTVSNGGNVRLSTVTVTDNNCAPVNFVSGDTNSDVKLGRTETWTYTCARTVLITDLPGPLANTVTASGVAPAGAPTVMDTDAASVNIAEIQVLKGTNPAVTTAKLDDIIPYTYAVTSIGNVPLSAVTLSDNKCSPVGFTGGDINTDTILDLTETWTYTCARTVLVGDLPGPLVNTATASGTSGGVTALDTDSVSVMLAGIQVVKSTNPSTTTSKVGSIIPYRYTVTGTGDAALGSVTVMDDKCSSVVLVSGDDGDSMLESGESWVYSCGYTVLAADLLAAPLVNTATATGVVNLVTVTDTDSISVDLAGINVVKTTNPVVSSATVGDMISYAYAVTNTGNVVLSAVTVSDNKCSPLSLPSGDTNTDTMLDLTETWTYTCTYTVQTADLPMLINTATAMGTSGGITASDTDMVSIDLGKLKVVKSTNPATPVSTVGAVIPYQYTVTNQGDAPISMVSLMDNLCSPLVFVIGGDANNDMKIQKSETWIYTCGYTVLAGDLLTAPLVNTVTATGQLPNGNPMADMDSESVDLAAIQVVKSIFPVVTLAAPGDMIPYVYTVTNLGSVALSTVTLNDDKCGPAAFGSGDTDMNTILDLLETWTYTCTYTVLQGDLPGPLVNTVTASGTVGGVTATDMDSESVDLAGIQVVKSTNPVITAAAVGDMIPYTYAVTAAGSVPLSTVTVSDDKCSPVVFVVGGDTNTDTILDLTETWTYTCTYTVLAGDLLAAPLVNTGTASGMSGSVTATDTDSYSVDIGDLRVVKSTNPATTTAKVGDVIPYRYELDNQGSGQLETITVTDNKCAPVVYVSGDTGPPNKLGKNEIWVYTCSYTVVAGDLPGPIVNTVTATGLSGSALLTDMDSESVDLAGIMVTKSASGAAAMTGDTITYTYTTTNTGGVALSTVTASDDKCAPVAFVIGGDADMDSMLDTSETWVYTCDYVVVAGDLPGPLINTATVSGTSGGVTATDTDTASVTLSVVAPPPSTLQLQMDSARLLTWNGVSGATNYHIYRGDLSVLRTTGSYVQDASASPNAARFCWMPTTGYDDGFIPAAGGAVFYLVAIDNGASEGSLGNDSQGQEIPNNNPCR